MIKTNMEIPFTLNNKSGILEVCYEENNSISKSGFDLLEVVGINPEMCLGYPTMHAHFKDYGGTGYSTTNAWIQIISNYLYSSLDDDLPKEVITEVDACETMIKLGVPFFAYGYAAEVYDAPCNNLGNYEKSRWVADTFLVTHPSPINNNTVSYLIGFRWGYEEFDLDGKRQISILPIEVTNITLWNDYLPMLRKDYPNWKFE